MLYSAISGCLLRHGLEVVAHQYNLSDDKQYNGKDLVKALSLKSSHWLTNMRGIDPNKILKGHIGIFR
jgi:hypothetical protein